MGPLSPTIFFIMLYNEALAIFFNNNNALQKCKFVPQINSNKNTPFPLMMTMRILQNGNYCNQYDVVRLCPNCNFENKKTSALCSIDAPTDR